MAIHGRIDAQATMMREREQKRWAERSRASTCAAVVLQHRHELLIFATSRHTMRAGGTRRDILRRASNLGKPWRCCEKCRTGIPREKRSGEANTINTGVIIYRPASLAMPPADFPRRTWRFTSYYTMPLAPALLRQALYKMARARCFATTLHDLSGDSAGRRISSALFLLARAATISCARRQLQERFPSVS